MLNRDALSIYFLCCNVVNYFYCCLALHINAGLQAQFFKKITFWQPSIVKCSLQNKETKKLTWKGAYFMLLYTSYLPVIYLTCIYEWQEDHSVNIQTKAISLKPQYTNKALQIHVNLSVSFRNGWYNWILCVEGSIYSFGYSLRGDVLQPS